MSLFADFEKSIERGFRKWTERVLGPAEANELMLVHRAILEQISGRVETLARGKRIFPYGRVIVTLCPADADRRASWQAAFSGGARLETDVRELLQAAGCELSQYLSIEVRAAEPQPADSGQPFRIEFLAEAVMPSASQNPQVSESPVVAVPSAVEQPARLVVVKGKAQREEYVLDAARTNLGRLAELTDSEHRVMRRNHIVFEEDADEVNATVSRRHAHIRREAGDYRLCDDESEFGTRVFRNGRPIEVPAGNRRGEKLRPGDEIYLGRACLRFEQ
jgi:hypothetical protein